ncbi:MAG TPA: ATP-dependent metallopeptidase FtsH/Yme1/Tma family protein [Gammaproteobacteria bacterium]|nr:ATP-dependent metallopeptidase FtsH/Yme1/Tma family protein [Gammaproteobacteria bacterium]
MEAQMKINGGAVRALREQKSWSQEHLASASGLSVRTVQRVEVESVGSAETRLALAAALGVPVADLLCEAVPRSKDVPGVTRRLSPRGWIGVGVVLSVVMAVVLTSLSDGRVTEYSTFLSEVSADQIARVTFDRDVIRGRRRSGEKFVVYNPEIDNRALIDSLRGNKVVIEARMRSSLVTQLFVSSLPFFLLVAAGGYFFRRHTDRPIWR